MPETPTPVSATFSGESAMETMLKNGKELFRNFKPSEKVLIKINLNSANPYPASTSGKMLELLLELLSSLGIRKISIADCSGLTHLPTRKVIKKKDFKFIKKYKTAVKSLDYGNWIEVPIEGEYFKHIVLSKYLYEFDKIINLANLKSHTLAGFSFATKSLVGFMHPKQRRSLHQDHLQQRIAEIALAVQPDLNIIDARKIFITGGPDTGEVFEAKSIIVDSDLLKADQGAYKLLFSAQQKSGIRQLPEDPYHNDFFIHFKKIQLLPL